MKRTFVLLATAALVLFAAGVRAAAPPAPTIVLPSAVKWVAGTGDEKGTWSAVLYGDPTKKGSEYAVRLKFPDGFKFPAHAHGGAEQVTVLSGTLMVGLGKKFDATKLTALPAGSFAMIPANLPHYAAAKGETVIEIHGIGPESMTMVKGGM
jgi:quercetin dioxygenase-like cupin family protein